MKPLAVIVVSLSSLTIFLMPLIALLISYDAIVGEVERGCMLLLLTYPVTKGQILLGKFLGHTGILAIATVVGYGAAGVAAAVGGDADAQSWRAFANLIVSSVLLGCACLLVAQIETRPTKLERRPPSLSTAFAAHRAANSSASGTPSSIRRNSDRRRFRESRLVSAGIRSPLF